jgi:hypothetical protein
MNKPDSEQASTVEITAPMLEAGVMRLYDFIGLELSETVSESALENMARAIYSAMRDS